MPLELRKARPEDFAALQQMLELYQYELSDIWSQDADTEAKFGFDLERYRQGERFHAHVALVGSQYVGFALVAPAIVTRKNGSWMEQFFILKRYRRSGSVVPWRCMSLTVIQAFGKSVRCQPTFRHTRFGTRSLLRRLQEPSWRFRSRKGGGKAWCSSSMLQPRPDRS